MPKSWIYLIALILPLTFSLLVLHTGFAEWLWYRGYEREYYLLVGLRTNELFIEFMGGWALPLFTCIVFSYWIVDHDDEAVASQFLLLPILYVPFSIIVTMLTRWQLDIALFYFHPLVIIPVGYLYLFPWLFFVGVFSKLRLVM